MAAEYEDYKCLRKEENNCLIARWALENLSEGFHPALVIDGPSARTSSTLIDTGVSTRDLIFAPQFSETDAGEMRRHNFCHVLEMTVSEAVSNINGGGIPREIMETIAVFNLDFMGSVFGRRACTRKRLRLPEVYPLNDLSDCLSKTRVKDAIVAITVSDRMGSKMTKDVKYFEGMSDFGEQLIQDFFTPIIYYHKYRIVKENYNSYSRKHVDSRGKEKKGAIMWFFIFYITKDEDINPDEIEFARDPFKDSLYWGFNPGFDDSWIAKEDVCPSKSAIVETRKRDAPSGERVELRRSQRVLRRRL